MLQTKILSMKFPFSSQSSSLVSLQNIQSQTKKSKNPPVLFPITDVLFTSHFILSVFVFYPLMLCFLSDRTLFLAAECQAAAPAEIAGPYMQDHVFRGWFITR